VSECGCCEGIAPATPVTLENRPGLSAIAYRAGTFAEFRALLRAALSSTSRPALGDLATREDDDFTIALLDAWAAVGDVLTFYGERAANEAYLRTASERLSLLQLARLIGYELRPGVAASAPLAFELETAEGAPEEATIPAGTAVLSVPGPDELPQTFETSAALVARPELNALRPRRLRPQGLARGMKSVLLAGLGLTVKPGDELLVVVDASGAHRRLRTALAVTEDASSATTRVDFDATLAQPRRYRFPHFPPGVAPAGDVALTDDAVRSLVLAHTWDAADLLTLAETQGWPLGELSETVNRLLAEQPAAGAAGVYAFGTRAAVFGHNAPAWSSLPGNLRFGERIAGPGGADVDVDAAYPTDWEDRTVSDDAGASPAVYLDAAYPKVVANGWVALLSPPKRASYRLLGSVELSRSDFTINAKVSRLTLDRRNGFELYKLRTTSVRGESRRLALADVAIADPVAGARIRLDGFHLGLAPGRQAILEGEATDLPGVRVREAIALERVTVEGGYTVLELTRALALKYVRASVVVNANVAEATMGESKQEVLGGGDAGAPYQRFPLRQPPLTYVSAPTASGAESTLKLYVDGVAWHEVPELYGQGPAHRVFITRLDDRGATTVEFGDGRTGARLPTGAENILARYRKGIGLAGQVGAGKLSLLLHRPLGVKAVSNPLPAGGAADPEHEDEARRNAPLRVLTLDRVVSLQDYEDFASAFAGLAKALATSIRGASGEYVLLTIAGPGGAVVDPASVTGTNLQLAIVAQGDVGARFELRAFRPALFELAAELALDPDHLPERVRPAALDALAAAFSFERRAFGQPVAQSEVLEVLQGVDGVVGVDLNTLARLDRAASDRDLSTRLWAAVPQSGDDPLLGAELLTLDVRHTELTVLT
jgi:hypothetical protein